MFVKVPLWEAILGKKQKYESAVSLAKFLILKDTSWDVPQTNIILTTPKTHKYGELASSNSWVQLVGEVQKTPRGSKIKTPETPLFLATKSGILEIVKEILNKYPQAIEHIDHEGRNILHVAIQYRQIHIFDFVEKMEVPMKNLMRKITDHGNSVLHMIGDKPDDDDFDEDMRSPALVLRENLLLFERVKKKSANNFKKHYNNDGKTADKLFAESNAKLRRDAQEWLKRTAENCSIVAVLISTVAFAAAYTVPGGPNQATGYPLLLNQPFFIIFALTDALSLTFALTSVITFLSILTSSFHLKDFKQSLPQKLMLGITLLILSVSMMMLAFGATVILLIRNKEQWSRIVSYSVAFLPVSIFTLTYLPLYIELMKTFTYTLKKISEAFPVVFVRSWVTKSLKCSRTSNPNDQSLANASSFTRSSAAQTTHDPV
ncbi:hypothetical protein CsSME_00037411 [Camellia sinensis var. sinensis]